MKGAPYFVGEQRMTKKSISSIRAVSPPTDMWEGGDVVRVFYSCHLSKLFLTLNVCRRKDKNSSREEKICPRETHTVKHPQREKSGSKANRGHVAKMMPTSQMVYQPRNAEH